jgi:hypothetical protein
MRSLALVLQWPSNMWTGPGWPDLLFSEWPLLVGVAVKYGRRSKPTSIQRSRHVELRNHHVPVYVVYGTDDAVHTIHTLKEKLPMAFDPALLAELEAALNDAPTEQPAPTIQEQATADQDAADLANGTATLEDLPVFEEIVLDADAPTPDIEDLTAAIVANEEITQAEAESQNASWLDKGPFAGLSGDEARMLAVTDALYSLKAPIEALTLAVRDLMSKLGEDTNDGTVDVRRPPGPAPRTRRPRRTS